MSENWNTFCPPPTYLSWLKACPKHFERQVWQKQNTTNRRYIGREKEKKEERKEERSTERNKDKETKKDRMNERQNDERKRERKKERKKERKTL